jgi:hypothetical protein
LKYIHEMLKVHGGVKSTLHHREMSVYSIQPLFDRKDSGKSIIIRML